MAEGTEGANGEAGRHGRLTDRDRQLVGLLAVARYLTSAQVARLVYPGREDGASRRRRLLALAGEGVGGFSQPALRRLQYRTYEGDRVAVWGLTTVGYLIAESVLGEPLKVPRGDIGADFLEHSVTLNELFVSLVASPVEAQLATLRPGPAADPKARRVFARKFEGLYARARQHSFRWSATESVRLPWSQYDAASGKAKDRIIQPDAVLEVPGAERRYFLECEMGTHTIAAVSDDKHGSTLSKVERYDEFMRGFADVRSKQTFYLRSFPDGWVPEVLFLVRSDARAASVNEAIASWRKGRVAVVRARALTFDAAAAELSAVLGRAPPGRSEAMKATSGAAAAPPPGLTPAEIAALRGFYTGAVGQLKAVRAAARARREAAPEYPADTQRVLELLQRLETLGEGV